LPDRPAEVTVRPNHSWRAWSLGPRTASDAGPGESSMARGSRLPPLGRGPRWWPLRLAGGAPGRAVESQPQSRGPHLSAAGGLSNDPREAEADTIPEESKPEPTGEIPVQGRAGT
jgi:hypothetical protein